MRVEHLTHAHGGGLGLRVPEAYTRGILSPRPPPRPAISTLYFRNSSCRPQSPAFAFATAFAAANIASCRFNALP